MSFYTDFNWEQPPNRWVAYVDLLGFGKIAKENDWQLIIETYAKALDLTRSKTAKGQVECTWFSDTFIFYTADDSAASCDFIKQAARHFIRELLQRGIPASGALSCGELFADKEKHLFVGKALAECAEYGERHNWIGFVVSPAALTRMAALGAKFPSANFRSWEVEIKPSKCSKDFKKETVLAYAIGNDCSINGKNFCREALVILRDKAPNDYVRRKYQNTIDFIDYVSI
jgi:hypothetical protein